MREILFRGKSLDFGDWLCGYIRQYESGKITICDFETKRLWFVNTETVGQFTGLTDKNGKKIFEGDVVKFTDSPFGYSCTGVVCFNGGSFCIKYEYWKKEKLHRIGQTDKWQDMGASGIITYQYEILGNIHDNPELLEA